MEDVGAGGGVFSKRKCSKYSETKYDYSRRDCHMSASKIDCNFALVTVIVRHLENTTIIIKKCIPKKKNIRILKIKKKYEIN